MNNLKQDLKDLNLSIVDLLPRGAIGRLADKHSISRQNIVKMLEGEFGKAERLTPLVIDALSLIEDHIDDVRKTGRKVKRIRKQLNLIAS